MKTMTIPATASHEQRDILIARMIRHLAHIQRRVERLHKPAELRQDERDEPAC